MSYQPPTSPEDMPVFSGQVIHGIGPPEEQLSDEWWLTLSKVELRYQSHLSSTEEFQMTLGPVLHWTSPGLRHYRSPFSRRAVDVLLRGLDRLEDRIHLRLNGSFSTILLMDDYDPSTEYSPYDYSPSDSSPSDQRERARKALMEWEAAKAKAKEMDKGGKWPPAGPVFLADTGPVEAGSLGVIYPSSSDSSPTGRFEVEHPGELTPRGLYPCQYCGKDTAPGFSACVPPCFLESEGE